MAGEDDATRRYWPDAAPFMVSPEFPPPAATVRVTFGARSRRGRSRAINEDHYVVFRLGRYEDTILSSLPDEVTGKRFDEYAYAMVVADGLGRETRAEAASRLAIATLLDVVRRFAKWDLRIDHRIANEIIQRVQFFYRLVDKTLVHTSQREPGGMLQTTMTAAFGAGRDLFFAHVGHSRAYLMRGGHLVRLTRDHTIGRLGRTKVPTGPIEKLEAAARDMTHVLTNTMGMGESFSPTVEIERFELADHDVVLVCTNGLTDAVDEEVIAEVLSSDRLPEDACRSLVDLAMSSGAEDDVTALIARYRIPE